MSRRRESETGVKHTYDGGRLRGSRLRQHPNPTVTGELDNKTPLDPESLVEIIRNWRKGEAPVPKRRRIRN